jgi:phosphoglycolate phosphatase
VTSSAHQHGTVFRPGLLRAEISHVIFDFDGTLSWLRSGWPDLMTGLFLELLPESVSRRDGFSAELRREILSLNGKPSIHQMHRFHANARALNHDVPDPESLLDLYLRRLDETLIKRTARLASGEAQPSEFVIPGAFELLSWLRDRGMRLVILSGTAEPDVKREARLLGLQEFFGEHIYGSTPGQNFSKKDVIDRILDEEKVQGRHLLAFGDGPVEIEFTKAVGGIAVGVASDEHVNGSGLLDADKHEHLLRAGADVIIPDYREARALLEKLFA